MATPANLTESVRSAIVKAVTSSSYSRGACIYCGGPARGIFCAGHRDLPAVDPALGGIDAALLMLAAETVGL